MDTALGLGLILGVLYLAYNSGAFAQFGVSPPVNPYNPYGPPPGGEGFSFGTGPNLAPGTNIVGGVNMTGSAITGGISMAAQGISSYSASRSDSGAPSGAASAAVAGLGIVASIAGALLAAHQQRMKQAQDENSAVNLGVQGYDQGMRQVNAAYNSRRIDAAGAISLVRQVMANYWALVSPRIQPGRNGCGSGGACPPWPSTGNGCSGSIGAACCVGCYDLAGGPEAHVFQTSEGGDGQSPYYFGAEGTLQVLMHGGGVVLYQAVLGSKYGGQNRAAYRLNWSQFSAA
jgi:hypothetical protein